MFRGQPPRGSIIMDCLANTDDEEGEEKGWECEMYSNQLFWSTFFLISTFFTFEVAKW